MYHPVEPEIKKNFGESELSVAEGFMYRDKPLTPKLISSLMHVDASLYNVAHHDEEVEEHDHSELMYTVGMWLLAVLIALGIGLVFLYVHKLGPFYDPVTMQQSFSL
mgnify:CR=1 FL=1